MIFKIKVKTTTNKDQFNPHAIIKMQFILIVLLLIKLLGNKNTIYIYRHIYTHINC